jgi:hypothetical protein
MAIGLDAIDRRAGLNGWSADMTALEKQKFTSGVHSSVFDTLLATDDVSGAAKYFDAHKDAMSAAARNDALVALKRPMEMREAAADFAAATSGGPAPGGATTVAAGTYASPVTGGHITNTFAQHEARGSAGLDIAVPVGSAIHPIAGGIVVAVSRDKNSGMFVKVKHPDGHTSSYSHMGNQSVKEGDPVGATTVLGTVGMTGHTEGPHVHLRVRDAQGHDVDPENLLGGGAAGGQVVGGGETPRRWDKAQVYSNIDAHVVGFERRERAKDYADRRISTDESMLNRQYDEAARDAVKTIVGLGDGFTSVTQIPKSVRDRMDPNEVLRLTGEASKNAERKSAIPANGSDAMTLEIMKRTDPDGFAAVELSKYVGKVAPNELRGFVLDQASAMGKPKPAFDPRGGIQNAIAWGKKYGGMAIDEKDFPAVYDAMDARLKGVQAAKGKVDPADYDEAFKAATRDITVSTSFLGIPTGSTTIKPYERTAGTMAPATRQSIIDHWRGAKPPTEEEILSVYKGM